MEIPLTYIEMSSEKSFEAISKLLLFLSFKKTASKFHWVYF
ncbi:hypothetical protein LEP1GSC188_2561 [Leptospira weilii serovar Topaz str. LT2116]|uniref:Uncharacterized protein n=1 Tax=Leptospira weilii serovar Topaz str. LT2116 TaxID=1088540 RepID=M3GT80_9LEPT|nr:hypothetical protein LEP1GSC188_2561 [Leptospira weilii serovar Topaz str. LT2116]